MAKPQATRKPRVLDGEAEAFLIATVCGAPPAGGFERWCLQLLKHRLVAHGYVDSVSHETVRQTLKKNELKPWLKRCWCIPPQANAAFVCAMEDGLDVYQRPADPDYPQVCLDEGAKQLLREVREPVPMTAGRPTRADYEYGREGVASFFVLFAPLLAWRHVAVTGRRRAVDFAHVVKDLVDVHFPTAKQIVRVMDNLNTHTAASLYQAFPPHEAKRLADKLAIHYTPKHGSWLNMAELERSVLARQCLHRRLPNPDTLTREVAAWGAARNAARTP